MANLRELNLGDEAVTEEGIRVPQQVLPQCKL